MKTSKRVENVCSGLSPEHVNRKKSGTNFSELPVAYLKLTVKEFKKLKLLNMFGRLFIDVRRVQGRGCRLAKIKY